MTDRRSNGVLNGDIRTRTAIMWAVGVFLAQFVLTHAWDTWTQDKRNAVIMNSARIDAMERAIPSADWRKKVDDHILETEPMKVRFQTLENTYTDKLERIQESQDRMERSMNERLSNLEAQIRELQRTKR